MSDSVSQTRLIDDCLVRLRAGDPAAREQLLGLASERLVRMTRKMKRDFPALGRWEQTEDVFQNASVRLWNALAAVQVEDVRHFYRLAATQIRRELIDLARHYSGAEGMGRHHATEYKPAGEAGRAIAAFEPAELTHDPQRVLEWVEFHEKVEQLPEAEREAFDLLWYHGLSQEEAAEVLSLSVRQVKRRWRAARLSLHDALGGESPT